MPKWGLTQNQRQIRPWGLDAALLEPAKTTTDPIHSDVYLTDLEQRIVDSRPMQHLRRVRQLGTTHLVYQGATHSRFAHSLGTLRAAQDLLDAVADNALGPRPPEKHLLAEWSKAEYDRKWAEATVLARLGALMHDICHVPFGHTIEDDLRVLDPHDGNAKRFERLWRQLDPLARRAIEGADGLMDELRRLILSKEPRPEGSPVSRYPFVADIVGNTICADLMDYLSRDHQATGLPMDVGVRFINDFYVSSQHHALHAARMVIKIDRSGHVRTDVVDEITKYLRYRYEESERALFHHAKTAADAMIGKMLEMWTDALWLERAADLYPELALEHTVLSEFRAAVDTAPLKGRAAKDIDRAVKSHLELLFTSASDDSLLEMLAKVDEGNSDSRLKAVSRLANGILDRHLYKPIGVAEGESARSNADDLHEKFGAAGKRRAMEIEAAAFAGIDPAWAVVLWMPKPSMRFKVADVLVDKNGSISHLANVAEGRDARRLVKKHEGLWSVIVYARESLRDDELRIEELLCSLQSQTWINFTTWDGKPIPPMEKVMTRRLIQHGLILEGNADAVEDLYHSKVAAKNGPKSFQRIARQLLAEAGRAGMREEGVSAPRRL